MNQPEYDVKRKICYKPLVSSHFNILYRLKVHVTDCGARGLGCYILLPCERQPASESDYYRLKL